MRAAVYERAHQGEPAEYDGEYQAERQKGRAQAVAKGAEYDYADADA